LFYEESTLSLLRNSSSAYVDELEAQSVRKYNMPRVAVQSLCQGAKKTSRNLEGGSKYKNTVPSFNTT
jgi:hypothetical protein